MPGARVSATLRTLDTDASRVGRDDDGVPIRRLPHFDYSSEGAYFLTICTHRRALLFGSDSAASALEACWREIPSHFPVELDAFVVMPNHVHGILWLARAGHARPLPLIVGSFKSAAAKSVNRLRNVTGQPLWQRGYYERVVRDERELEALRQYIVDNPASWDSDPDNPRATAIATAPWA